MLPLAMVTTMQTLQVCQGSIHAARGAKKLPFRPRDLRSKQNIGGIATLTLEMRKGWNREMSADRRILLLKGAPHLLERQRRELRELSRNLTGEFIH